jgi:ABC-type nitrate/sulfonate/bicarbonate transport system substrate-binding protein
MKPTVFIGSIIVVAIISIFALLSLRPPQEQSIAAPIAPTAISLRLNGPFGPTYAGEMVAARSGLFERAGLNLSLKPGNSDADTIALVSSGADTFGVTRGDAFLLARAKGQ